MNDLAVASLFPRKIDIPRYADALDLAATPERIVHAAASAPASRYRPFIDRRLRDDLPNAVREKIFMTAQAAARERYLPLFADAKLRTFVAIFSRVRYADDTMAQLEDRRPVSKRAIDRMLHAFSDGDAREAVPRYDPQHSHIFPMRANACGGDSAAASLAEGDPRRSLLVTSVAAPRDLPAYAHLTGRMCNHVRQDRARVPFEDAIRLQKRRQATVEVVLPPGTGRDYAQHFFDRLLRIGRLGQTDFAADEYLFTEIKHDPNDVMLLGDTHGIRTVSSFESYRKNETPKEYRFAFSVDGTPTLRKLIRQFDRIDGYHRIIRTLECYTTRDAPASTV